MIYFEFVSSLKINLLKSKMIPVGEVEGMDRFESSFRVGNPLPT